MRLPGSFTRKVYRMFGESGVDWLKSVDDLFDLCVSKWQLTNLVLSPSLSFSLVYFADSPQYGPVALKTVVPHNELYTEMTALELYAGKGICRCYEASRDIGAMLIERLQPGRQLLSVLDWSERLQIASDVINALPRPSIMAEMSTFEGLPDWDAWTKKAFDDVRSSGAGGTRMRVLVEEAEETFKELTNGSRPKVLLHGDLHHTNILFDDARGWLAIDPKGSIGVPCLQCARFITNEIDDNPPDQKVSRMIDMMEQFAKVFGESPKSIADCAFIDRVLGTSWSFSEFRPASELDEDIATCEFFRDMKNMR